MAQATALARFTRTLDGPDVMVVGDLNSYGDEDPIDVLKAAGFVDLIESWLAEGTATPMSSRAGPAT